MKSFKFRRIVSFLVLFTFLWTQMASPQELQLVTQSTFQPTKGPVTSENSQVGPTQSVHPIPQTTEQFLQGTLTLTPVSKTTEDQEVKPIATVKNEDSKVQPNQDFEYTRYDFKDALDLLRPEYASAVIVKNLTSEDLHALEQLSFETGIIVLDGEIVLFTSGSSNEIGVLPAVRELVAKATFISHTHVDEFSKDGPSGQDLNEVLSSSPEYVITRNGVYAYNNEGVLNNGNPYSYDDYLDQLNQAVKASTNDQNQVQARADLNQFIKDQDQYNLAPQSEKQTLLMGGTLTFTSGLTSANVTTLPGSPYPYFMTGSSSGTTLSLGADSRFQLGYNVSTVGSYSGTTISFDNASTTAVETQNLSTFTNVIFGLQGPATALKLEFVDINGNKDSYTLTNISSTTEQFWSIATSTIAATVDKTRIKQINLFVDQSTTTSTTLTGTVYIRSNGLNTNAPTQPVVTSTIPTSTNKTTLTLSGTKDANTAILINGATYVALNSSTTWSTTISLTIEGNNTFNITEKNSIGKLSTVKSIAVLRDTIVPTGSININSGATYTNSTSITLNLSATDSSSGINTMSFSTDNVTYSTPEAYATSKTYTLPTGDGTKTVYVKFYDKAGNTVVYSKSIILDTTPPAINLVSVALTNSSNYTLTYTVDGVTKQEQVTLQEGKNYIVRSSTDLAGNSTTKTFQISLDAQLPAVQSLQINQGSTMTKTANVTLNLIAYDLGTSVTQMSFSNDGVNYSTPETYAMTKVWTLTDGRAQKTIWVKVKDASGFWSNPVSATIFYQKVLTLDDFDGTTQVQNYWDGSGYQRSIVASGAFDGIHAMQVNFQKTSLLPYSYFALVPKQDGVANDFSTYRTLRIQLNKLQLAPMVLMVKLEFNGTSQTFETQVGVPQGTYGWQEAVFDFSTVSPSLLANVKDILFFVDPGNPSSQGSFMMDSIRLDEWPETKVVDDFEGNNIPLQTYWDSNGSLIYQRSLTETNSYDGTHSMKVTYTKKPGYPYSFFAWTPKQNGADNNFTNYGSLRFNLNKISSSPMVIMMKLEFNGTTQTFEEQLSFPQGSNQWQEVVFDLSQVSASLLASVKNVLFFVDPASETTTGSFYMDRIRLAERPVEWVLDDFEGNGWNGPIRTFWDGDGSGTVYTRWIDNTQAYDGTHSMQINYNKSTQYVAPYFSVAVGSNNYGSDFSRFNVLKMFIKKDSIPAMKLMMKFELLDTQINFEAWKEIPQGQTGWTELDYDFSSLDPSLLKKVKNVFFFVDPMFYTTPQPSQGSFHLDSIRLVFDSNLPAKDFDPTKPPQVGWVASSAAGDNDNEYHIGSLVRINAWELNAASDLLDGTVRVFSKSTGYDSGEQRFVFTHDGQFWPFHWDTTGLKAADDYGVIVTMRDKSGNVTVVGSETSPAITIKLTKGVSAGGNLISVQDFSLPLLGGSLPVARSYDPVDAEIFDHQLGLGWHSSLDYFVQDFPDGTASVSLGAEGYQFYFKNSDGTYRSMAPNNYSTLTKISGGFQIKFKDGTIYQFTSSPFIDTNTKLTTTWFITKIVDTNGNQTQFFYDQNRNLTKVQAASGDFIQLQYSFRTRDQFNTDKYNLDKIIDQAGNAWSFVHDAKGNLISVTDPLGAKTTYEYDSKSRLTKMTYPDTSTQSYTYDSEGRILQVLRNGVVQSQSTYGDRNSPSFSVQDALGRISNYTLSDEGLITQSTDPTGATTQFTYDAKRNLIKKIDPQGNVYSYTYDSVGNLLTSTDPLGKVTTYTYEPNFNKAASAKDALGNTTQFAYDAKGNLIKVTDPALNMIQNTYDVNGNLIQTKDPLGNLTNYTYNLNGLPLTKTDALGNKTSYQYDSKGNVVKVTDPLAGVTQFTYDALGHVLSQTDALGRTVISTYDSMGRVVQMKDPLGNTETNQYNLNGQLISEMDALGGKTLYSYDAKGNLISQTDPLGNVTTFTYDSLDRLIQAKDPLGRISSFTYDSLGRKISQTDPLGNKVQFQYDALGRLTKTTFPNGAVQTTTYDALGRTLSQTDALGNITRFSYDSRGNLISQTDALGLVTTFTYDARNQRTSQKDALGNITSFQYDALGRLVKTTYADGASESRSYDALSQLTKVIDPLGRTTSFTYDSLGRKISQTDALGNVVQFEYDAVGRLTKTTFPNGAIQTATYDALGRTVSQTDALGNITRFSYDSRDNLVSQTDALGSVTTFTYDAVNLRTSQTDVLGNVTRFDYDALGRLIKTTYADGATELRSYDTLSRLVKVTDPLSRSVVYAYDALGNLIQTTDPVGNISQAQYDALNRKIKEIDALGNATTYTYDALGRTTKILDAKGNATTMTYDLLGRLLSRTYPDASSESFTYDAVGNVTQSKDRMGRTTSFSYDAGNRLTQKLFPDSSKETFTYDVMGNVLTITNSTGTIQNQYDLLGRLTKQTDVFGNILTYTYDAIGNRKSLAATIGISTLSRTYTYDALGRLTQIQDALGRKTTYTYDSRSRVVQKLLPNTTKTAFTYDLASELTQITHKDLLGNAFRTLQYTYDNRGLIINKTDSFEGTSSFNYDKLGELISMTHPVIGLVTFALDQLGNRTQVSTAGTPQNYTTNTLNEYTAGGTETFQYDLDGNLISRKDTSTNLTTSYNYDFNNRLTKVTNPDGTLVTFTYDELGRRITKTVGSTTTRFLWDGAELLAELDTSNKLLKSYVHGPEVDETLYQDDAVSGVTLYYHQDNLGSTIALTDSQGALKESYTYDPYGKLITAKDKSGNQVLTPSTRILYTGREFDQETKLYYNRARYYDPSLGRFLNADPKGYAAGLNLYAYTHNNPLSFRDPSGLDVYWGGRGDKHEYRIPTEPPRLTIKYANGVTEGYYDAYFQYAQQAQQSGGKKKHKSLWRTILGIAAAVVAVAIAAPFIGAIAGAIGSAISGVVGGVAGAVAGSAIGSAVGAAVGSIAATAAFAAGSAVVATATSNLVQGAPVFRGVGMSAAFAAITAGAFKAVSVIGKGIQQGFQSIASTVGNTGKTFGSEFTQVGDKIQQSVRNNFFRPESAGYVVGKEGPILNGLNFSHVFGIFEPGKFPMTLLEDYVPTMHQFGIVHDKVAGTLFHAGVPDVIANIPTMPPAYATSLVITGFNVAQDIVDGMSSVVNR